MLVISTHTLETLQNNKFKKQITHQLIMYTIQDLKLNLIEYFWVINLLITVYNN